MLKPKEALVKSGFLPPGSENKRGRLSGAAIDECKRLVAEEGYSIDGYVSSTVTAVKSDTPVTVDKIAKRDPNSVYDVPSESRPREDFEAYRVHGTKHVDVGMCTVCNLCKCSLNYCRCARPEVNVDYDTVATVHFTTRKTPLSVRYW